MPRYIGLDVHKATCTMVVLGPSGKKVSQHVVETNAELLVDRLRTIARTRHLCFEEGTQSAWVYEVLSPRVDETVVTVKQERRGANKDDARDALELADKLRTNSLKVRAYKEVGRYGRLRDLTKVHGMQVRDSVRLQNRILSLYRSRGIDTSDSLYHPDHRAEWIGKLPARMQTAAESLLRQYDAVEPLRRETEKTMVKEARKQPEAKLLATVPGLGPIRVAYLMSIIVSPYRFRTREQLWPEFDKLGAFWAVTDSSFPKISSIRLRPDLEKHRHTTSFVTVADPVCPGVLDRHVPAHDQAA